jgi:MFS family permease
MSMQTPYPTTGPPQPWGYYRRDLKTEKGLKHINWGIMAYITAAVLSFLTTMISLYVILSADPTALGEAVGGLMALAALACGGIILFIFALIMWLLGLSEMHSGRDEFGPKHSKNVGRAIVYIVLYIVMIILAFVVGFVAGFSMVTSPGFSIDTLRMVLVIAAIMGVFSTVLLGLAIVYLIHELCDEKYKKILWVGFIVAVLASAVGGVLSIASQYGDPQSALTGGASSLISGFDFIAFILFLLCYRHAYSRVREGVIQPYGMGPPGAYAPYAPPATPGVPSYRPVSTESCPACGASLSGGQRFCYNCGSRLG